MNWKKIELFKKIEQFKKNRTEIEQTEIKENRSRKNFLQKGGYDDKQ